MNPKISIEEAAQIMKDRFSPGSTPRSSAYKEGYSERLQRVATNGKHRIEPHYKAGTPEFDAYYSGNDHAFNSIDVFIGYREDPGDDPVPS